MNIAVHAKVLSEKQLTGIGFYAFNILKALAGADSLNKYTLFSNEPLAHSISAGNFSEKILNFPAFWSYIKLPLELKAGRYDLLFVPKEMVPPLAPRSVMTVYDLGMTKLGGISLQSRIHFLMAKYFHVKRAAKIVAISESTKNELVKMFKVNPGKISVVYPGCDLSFYKRCGNVSVIEEAKAKYGITGNYIINPSSLSWHRKNIGRLIEAFAACVKKHSIMHSLVITGKKSDYNMQLTGLIEKLSIGGRIIFTGYVDSADMPLLLSGADVFAFPSLHEGFGMPIVEAMACGCPVITGNCSAMPEVAGDAGILVDPLSIDEITEALYKLTSNDTLRHTLIQKGYERAKLFAWDTSAGKLLETFKQALS